MTEGRNGDLSDATFTWDSDENLSRYQARHIKWIADNIVANLPSPTIRGCTEHKRVPYLFRGHPQFRSQYAWHDWAMIRWDSTSRPTPAEIVCFFGFDGRPS